MAPLSLCFPITIGILDESDIFVVSAGESRAVVRLLDPLNRLGSPLGLAVEKPPAKAH
jgi:hypothetical protein